MENDIYKKMYLRFFNRITDAIEACQDEYTKKLLIEAQQETEEMYIRQNELKIIK